MKGIPKRRVNARLVVKIGDFGLARDVYMGKYYRANAGARLPVKWMAPETFHDAISNEKTDVVSISVYTLQLQLFDKIYCMWCCVFDLWL